MSRKNNPYYVSNKLLFETMCAYKNSIKLAEQRGEQKPRLPEYVGSCIMLIAKKLASKSNFSDYSWKEEMICDGIENCIMYIDNFNPEKSNNPFAYITQIIKNAFIRRIQKEKKEQYIKYKNMANVIPEWELHPSIHSQHDDVSNHVISSFETTMSIKKQKNKEKAAQAESLLE